jgi:hypothetical protein
MTFYRVLCPDGDDGGEWYLDRVTAEAWRDSLDQRCTHCFSRPHIVEHTINEEVYA